MERGFTLIELLLSVAIIGILVGISLPMYQAFQKRSDLDVTTQGLASALRRAQSYARNGNGDSIWGVRLQQATGEFYVYKGSTFASRDTAFDEATGLLGASVNTSGLTDVTFAKLSGAPSTTGTITLTGSNNESRTVTLNAEGMVAY